MNAKKTIILAICLVTILGALQAQTLQFSDIYLFGGSANTGSTLRTWEVNEMEKGLYEPSAIKPSLYRNYRRADNFRYSNQVGIMAAWNINGNEKKKLRVGFSGGNYQVHWNDSYTDRTEYRVDTFISQRDGSMIFVDSAKVRNLSYAHNAEMFNLHINYLQTLNPQNKLSFYVGCGLSLGFSLNNTVSSFYSEYDETNAPFSYSNQNVYGTPSGTYLDKEKSLSPTTNISGYALTGLNWRLSNKNKFFKHINIFGEWRTGLELNRMQEINHSIGFLNGATGGVRVSFNDPKIKK